MNALQFEHCQNIRSRYQHRKDIYLVFEYNVQSTLALELLKNSQIDFEVFLSPFIPPDRVEYAHYFLANCAQVAARDLPDQAHLIFATPEARQKHELLGLPCGDVTEDFFKVACGGLFKKFLFLSRSHSASSKYLGVYRDLNLMQRPNEESPKNNRRQFISAGLKSSIILGSLFLLPRKLLAQCSGLAPDCGFGCPGPSDPCGYYCPPGSPPGSPWVCK